MSSSIWTRYEGRSRLAALAGEAWRVVESQHLFSTRALVDSDAEHRILEDLIEGKKPRGEATGLHFLLATPFRYSRAPMAARFGSLSGRGSGTARPRRAPRSPNPPTTACCSSRARPRTSRR